MAMEGHAAVLALGRCSSGEQLRSRVCCRELHQAASWSVQELRLPLRRSWGSGRGWVGVSMDETWNEAMAQSIPVLNMVSFHEFGGFHRSSGNEA